jgi:hypothetical protein
MSDANHLLLSWGNGAFTGSALAAWLVLIGEAQVTNASLGMLLGLWLASLSLLAYLFAGNDERDR